MLEQHSLLHLGAEVSEVTLIACCTLHSGEPSALGLATQPTVLVMVLPLQGLSEGLETSLEIHL